MTGRRTKRAAYLFEHMDGPDAQAQVFAAGKAAIADLNFVGVISQTRGCVLILQRSGLDIKVKSVWSTLAIQLHMIPEQIKVVPATEAKDMLKNVVWSMSEGTLKLGGRAKKVDTGEYHICNLPEFNIKTTLTDEEIRQEVADLLSNPKPKDLSMLDKVCIQDHHSNKNHQCSEGCLGITYNGRYGLIDHEDWETFF